MSNWTQPICMRCFKEYVEKELIGRYDRIDGLNWRNILDLTKWTMKQFYPWIEEKGK